MSRNTQHRVSYAERVELAAKAIGSLLWLVDNAHNADSPIWGVFEAAAREDAKRALDALEVPATSGGYPR